jgi:hypothetical protein
MREELRRWTSSGNDGDRITYIDARDEYYALIRKAKSRTWEDFMMTLQGKETWAIMRYTKQRSTQTTPHILDSINQPCSIFATKAPVFVRTHFPSLPPPPRPEHNPVLFTLPRHDHLRTHSTARPTAEPITWTPITDAEVQTALLSSHPGKAPGPDGISFIVLRRVYLAIPKYVNALYRALGQTGYHPHCWRTAITCIIPKPDNPTTRYRKPIALSSFLTAWGSF